MVRILKVKDLEDRKRFLIARSEMYRQTLRLETANIKYSLALLKRKLDFLKTTFRVLGGAAPLAGPLLLDGPIRRGSFSVHVVTVLAPTRRRCGLVVMDNHDSHKFPPSEKRSETAVPNSSCCPNILPT